MMSTLICAINRRLKSGISYNVTILLVYSIIMKKKIFTKMLIWFINFVIIFFFPKKRNLFVRITEISKGLILRADVVLYIMNKEDLDFYQFEKYISKGCAGHIVCHLLYWSASTWMVVNYIHVTFDRLKKS